MTGNPENIADAAMFLASSDSEYMDGQVLVVDGGRIDNLAHKLDDLLDDCEDISDLVFTIMLAVTS